MSTKSQLFRQILDSLKFVQLKWWENITFTSGSIFKSQYRVEYMWKEYEFWANFFRKSFDDHNNYAAKVLSYAMHRHIITFSYITCITTHSLSQQQYRLNTAFMYYVPI